MKNMPMADSSAGTWPAAVHDTGGAAGDRRGEGSARAGLPLEPFPARRMALGVGIVMLVLAVVALTTLLRFGAVGG